MIHHDAGDWIDALCAVIKNREERTCSDCGREFIIVCGPCFDKRDANEKRLAAQREQARYNARRKAA
jgi:hypothetical protein